MPVPVIPIHIVWRTMDSAPKSTVEAEGVQGIFILAYCPDERTATGGAESGVLVIWWEPNERSTPKGRPGCWFSEAGPVRPVLWTALTPLLPSNENLDKPEFQALEEND